MAKMARDQKTCPHSAQTLAGSNAVQRRITCKDCGKVLLLAFHHQIEPDLLRATIIIMEEAIETRETAERSAAIAEPTAAVIPVIEPQSRRCNVM